MRWFQLSMALLLVAGCDPLSEAPPRLPDATKNGGRTQSITVNPKRSSEITIATEFGGLWQTSNAGQTWKHLDGLNYVYVNDVQYGGDGVSLVATVGRSNREDHPGGIWVSKDGGTSWTRPTSAKLPASSRLPKRTQAYGVDNAPDDPNTWYVGTDYGVAISHDNAATWRHAVLGDPRAAVDTDSCQNRVQAVVSLAGGEVLAMTRTAIWRSNDAGATWSSVKQDDFRYYEAQGWNKLDRWPGKPVVAVVKNATSLYLYEPAVFSTLTINRWTLLDLPTGYSDQGRSTFVRFSRDQSIPDATRLWVGQNDRMVAVTRKKVASFRALTASSWTLLGTEWGWHSDMGDLGVDASGAPAMFGDDGGVFKPDPENLGSWISAAAPGSGMNSLQVTSLLGVNQQIEGRNVAALHFGTQDNWIWGSLDGNAWTGSDGAEGFLLQGPYGAGSQEAVTIGYIRIAPYSAYRMSGLGLANQRNAEDRPEWLFPDGNGNQQTRASELFYVKQDHWLRIFSPGDGGLPQILISDDDGSTWRSRFTLALQREGVIKRTNIQYAARQVEAWMPVRSVGPSARIGLVRLSRLKDPGTDIVGTGSLVLMPNGGSLGKRATQFDWQAVFGVDPFNADRLLVPDVTHGFVMGSIDGGKSWYIDKGLTTLVTESGQVRLYDGGPYSMGITEIAFDPYRPGRILVGTRETGIVCTNDNGRTWGTIPRSQRALYVTGFQFRPDGSVMVSTYGRGLWFLASGSNSCVDGLPRGNVASGSAFVPQPASDLLSALRKTPNWPEDAAVAEPPGFAEKRGAFGDDPLAPRLIGGTMGGLLGGVVVPSDNSMQVSAFGFSPRTPLEVFLDDTKWSAQATPSRDGSFVLLSLQVPPALTRGEHQVRVVQGEKAASLSIRKVRLEDHLSTQPEKATRSAPVRREPTAAELERIEAGVPDEDRRKPTLR